jgi:hypothetical protein
MCDPAIFELGVPLLGICYGMQLMGRHLGGEVRRGESREYGLAQIEWSTDPPGELFTALPDTLSVWMSHGDQVAVPPPGFRVTARTDTCPVAAMEHPERHSRAAVPPRGGAHPVRPRHAAALPLPRLRLRGRLEDVDLHRGERPRHPRTRRRRPGAAAG